MVHAVQAAKVDVVIFEVPIWKARQIFPEESACLDGSIFQVSFFRKLLRILGFCSTYLFGRISAPRRLPIDAYE